MSPQKSGQKIPKKEFAGIIRIDYPFFFLFLPPDFRLKTMNYNYKYANKNDAAQDLPGKSESKGHPESC
jgi:hypothetical protein